MAFKNGHDELEQKSGLMGATMRKWLWLLFIPALFSLVAGLIVVSLAEYTETGRCYRNGSILSAEELRMQTIRSLLADEKEAAERENTDRTYVKAFLIPRSLTSEDVINAVVSKSIVNLPKEATFPISTESDVVNVNSKFLHGDFSIILYGGGYVFITPSGGIKAVDSKVAQKYLDEQRKPGFQLSLFERALGYGNHYFQVDAFSHIDLGCCEDRYVKNPKGGLSSEWYTREIIRRFENRDMLPRSYLVVSNCGDILHRQSDEGITNRF